MEQKLSRNLVMLLTLLLAVIAGILRVIQLHTAFDYAGMVTGDGVGLFAWVTAIVVVLFALYSRSLRGRKKYTAITGQSTLVLAVSGAAALLLVISGLLLLIKAGGRSDRVVAVGSMLTGLCWAAVAAYRRSGKTPHAALFLFPTIFYVVELVCWFRVWTRDPVILDYCYDLLALISIMCALLHLGSFCFERGARRRTVFFSMCGVFFCAAALVGAPVRQALGYCAAMLWLLANLWLLLRPGKQK